MPLLKKKPEFEPDDRVRAIQSFATETRTIRSGDVLRGDDPLVVGTPEWFELENTPSEEARNIWNEMPPPPLHDPGVADRKIMVAPPNPIPVHRQVKSLVETWTDMGYAPGSPGEKSGRPSGFGSAVRAGQVFDVLDPLVARHPDWFQFPARGVTLEDVERLAAEEVSE
jgi:hypothetical protein